MSLSISELTGLEAVIRTVLNRHRADGASPTDAPGDAVCDCGGCWVETAEGDADYARHAEQVAREVADALLATYGDHAFERRA